MATRKGIALLLLLALAAHAKEELEGKITGGKAKKLVAAAIPLLNKARSIMTEAARMPVDEGPEYEGKLKEAIRLFDEGTFKLNEALDIQYDGGVNGMLVNAAKKLAWARARLLRLENKRRFRDRPPAKPREEDPKPKEEPVPERKPDPVQPPVREPEPEEFVPAEPERMEFADRKPPAVPVAVDLPEIPLSDSKEQAKQEKRDRKSIATLLKAHFTARKKGKLRYDCKLCSGKGKFRDGSACPDCKGAGSRINLHHFRKVFWTSYSPLLRDAAGALDALKAFHAHASSQPDLLGAPVKTFKLVALEYHGTWAKAKVQINSTEGSANEEFTLVGIGSTWFFYCPATDAELIGADE